MKLLLPLVLAFGLGAPIQAQDRAATMFFIIGETLDNVTTAHNGLNGWRESNPVYYPIRDQPRGVMVASIASDLAFLWLAHRIAPSHPRWANAMLWTAGTVGLSCAATNARVW